MKNFREYIRSYWTQISAVITVVFLTGGAWNEFANIKKGLHETKIEISEAKKEVQEILVMKVKVDYMQRDIAEIRNIMENLMLKKY